MRKLVTTAFIGATCFLLGALFISRQQASRDAQLRQQIEADMAAKEKAASDAKAEAVAEHRKALCEAVLAVLKDNEAAMRECRAQKPFAIHTYKARLQEIDVSRCTRKFQEAWTDYTMAWSELAQAVDTEERQIERAQEQRTRKARGDLLFDGALFVAAIYTGGSSLSLLGAHASTAVVMKAGERVIGDQVRDASAPGEQRSTGNPYGDKILDAMASVRKAAIEAGVVFHAKTG